MARAALIRLLCDRSFSAAQIPSAAVSPSPGLFVRRPTSRSRRRALSDVHKASASIEIEDMHITRENMPSVQEVQMEVQRLAEDINAYAEANPHVEGTEKLLRLHKAKIASGLTGISGLRSNSSAGVPREALETLDLEGDELVKQVQGCINNIRGVRAELQAAELFPGVKAVCKSFHSKPGEGQVYAGYKYPEITKAKNSKQGLSVEIDVVAQGGAWWVEVKSHESFGINSTHWIGRRGHVKGLKDQAEERLAVASCPCNMIHWQQPHVIFFFPEGIDDEVANALKAMGAGVVDGRFSIDNQLPSAPPPMQFANLDVTTMCALVTEVSNGGAIDGGTPEVKQWAQRISHWVDSVEAEAKDPILPQLHAVFQGRTLIASITAVEHFEKLLATCGGPREKNRWQALKVSLVIVEPHPASSASSGSKRQKIESGEEADGQDAVQQTGIRIEAGAHLIGWPGSREMHCEFFSQRVARLQQVSAQQKWVFGLGDLAHAVTVTANGKVVKSAANQGVALNCHVHRAMWLAGL